MKKIFFSLVLAIFASGAVADGFSFQIHGTSYHFKSRPGVQWDDQNDGFGFRYAFNNTYSVQAGHYRNSQTFPGSFNFFTNYGLIDYTPIHSGPFHFGGFAGIASGYDKYTYTMVNGRANVTVTQDGVLAPVAGLVARYQGKIFNIALRLLPPAGDDGSAVIALEAGFGF